ncbi:D-aspartate oxidase isoform X2 [Aplysia californica]|uniref:D-aspartate oxidase isoform X2 n=1 Tax=Aplysia californica TaxID=6500 RepID=A0ABM0JDL2_APLCA|nr:D-aspartate oxidase isoform X2 [Aplysia californica]
MVRVAVIGAGMVGLCSAINVQKELPEAEVTVIADKFSTDTTSFGAGGFFRPFMPDIAKGVDLKVAEQWVRDSWKYYASLARSDLAKETGQTLVPGMIAYRTPQDQQYDLLKELVGDFHRVDLEHLQKLNLDTYTYAYAFTTIIVQTPKFLDWLMKKFVASGGKVQERTVKSLKELSSSFDIVVNCCGPRAQELLDDKSCFPIKGHIVMVRAPWQKQFFYGEGDIYLIPHDDKLIIGGIKDKDNGSMTKYPYVREHILSRALALFPQLKLESSRSLKIKEDDIFVALIDMRGTMVRYIRVLR